MTSGASSDLQQATRIAKQMVYKLGMGQSTGLMTFDPDSGPVSGTMHSHMDTDVCAILAAGYDDVLQMFHEASAVLREAETTSQRNADGNPIFSSIR